MEMKCFESRERFGSHLGPFSGILKQFEEIEKKVAFLHFSWILGTKCSNGMDLSPIVKMD